MAPAVPPPGAGTASVQPTLLAILALALLHFLLRVCEAVQAVERRARKCCNSASAALGGALPVSVRRMLEGPGAGLAPPQRGKRPSLATVLAVILADDGAAPMDAAKLAFVIRWAGQQGVTSVLLYHPRGIGAATESTMAAALEKESGGVHYSFRAAFKQEAALELLPGGSLPAPGSHEGGLEGLQAPDSPRSCVLYLSPEKFDDDSTSTGPEGGRSRSSGGGQGVGQQRSKSPDTSACRHVRVLTLAAADASWPLVSAAKVRCQRLHQPSVDGPVSVADASLCSLGAHSTAAATPGVRLMSGLVAVAGPNAALEPHMVLVIGQSATLAGFPSWLVRFSEFYLVGPLGGVTEAKLEQCWRRYYGTSQRFGA